MGETEIKDGIAVNGWLAPFPVPPILSKGGAGMDVVGDGFVGCLHAASACVFLRGLSVSPPEGNAQRGDKRHKTGESRRVRGKEESVGGSGRLGYWSGDHF